MSHLSKQTIAAIATKQDALTAEKNALHAAENSNVLKALQQEQQERDAIVRICLGREDLDLEVAVKDPAAVAKDLLALAEAIVKESNRRDYEAIVVELKRTGEAVRRDLRLICERHGIEVPEEEKKPVGPTLIKE